MYKYKYILDTTENNIRINYDNVLHFHNLFEEISKYFIKIFFVF